MLDGQTLETNKSLEAAERIERMSIKTDYELIFVVANEGYSDMIMGRRAVRAQAAAL